MNSCLGRPVAFLFRSLLYFRLFLPKKSRLLFLIFALYCLHTIVCLVVVIKLRIYNLIKIKKNNSFTLSRSIKSVLELSNLLLNLNQVWWIKATIITSSSLHLQDKDEYHAEVKQAHHLPFQYMCSVSLYLADLKSHVE